MTKRPGTKKWTRSEIMDLIDRDFNIADMMKETGTTKSNIIYHMRRLVKDGILRPTAMGRLENGYIMNKRKERKSLTNGKDKAKKAVSNKLNKHDTAIVEGKFQPYSLIKLSGRDNPHKGCGNTDCHNCTKFDKENVMCKDMWIGERDMSLPEIDKEKWETVQDAIEDKRGEYDHEYNYNEAQADLYKKGMGTMSDLDKMDDEIFNLIDDKTLCEKYLKKHYKKEIPSFMVDLEKEIRNIDINIDYLKQGIVRCSDNESLSRHTDGIKVYIQAREDIIKVKDFLKDRA
jgi:hypothetical protein